MWLSLGVYDFVILPCLCCLTEVWSSVLHDPSKPAVVLGQSASSVAFNSTEVQAWFTVLEWNHLPTNVHSIHCSVPLLHFLVNPLESSTSPVFVDSSLFSPGVRKKVQVVLPFSSLESFLFNFSMGFNSPFRSFMGPKGVSPFLFLQVVIFQSAFRISEGLICCLLLRHLPRSSVKCFLYLTFFFKVVMSKGKTGVFLF